MVVEDPTGGGHLPSKVEFSDGFQPGDEGIQQGHNTERSEP